MTAFWRLAGQNARNEPGWKKTFNLMTMLLPPVNAGRQKTK